MSGTPAINQRAYRIRTDAGAVNDAPSWGANENVDHFVGYDTNFRVRIGFENTGTGSATINNLTALRCGYQTGSNLLSTTSTFMQSVDGGSSADNAAITAQRLSNGTGTFANGVYDENGTCSLALANGTFSEIEVAIKLLAADCGGGETHVVAWRTAVNTITVSPVVTTPETTGSDFQPANQLGSAGQLVANSASISMTTIANATAGQLVVVPVACDNNGTTDGDFSEVSGVTINGETAAKAIEFTNGQGAAQAGATISIWWKVLAGNANSGSTITASFTTNTTSGDANAIMAKAFNVAAGKTVSVEATNTLANDGAALGSLDATTSNIECLRIRASALENAPLTVIHSSDGRNTKATSTDWSLWWNPALSDDTIGAGVTGMSILVENAISTGTGLASQIRHAGTADNASAYVAFKATATGGGGQVQAPRSMHQHRLRRAS